MAKKKKKKKQKNATDNPYWHIWYFQRRLVGWSAPIFDLNSFITGQAPNAEPPPSLHPSSVALAYQLANIYLLLFLAGVGVCYTTTEPKVLRNYVAALAIADIGHIYATYLGMGWETFVDLASWNALTWGNIGASAFLFANRVAYLGGAFGEPAPGPVSAESKKVT